MSKPRTCPLLTIHLFQSQRKIRGVCEADEAISLGFPSTLISNNLQAAASLSDHLSTMTNSPTP